MTKSNPPEGDPQPSDFVSLLRTELISRTRKNPRYSLRSFASFLEVQPGFLSKLLRGDRRPTARSVRRFGLKLGLEPAAIERFVKIHAKKTEGVAIAGLPNQESRFQQLTFDHFRMISDWYHFAILELARIQNFEATPRYISRALGITVLEANAAIDRLERLEFIEIQKNGSWEIKDANNTTLGTELTSSALRKLQRQVLEGAITALEDVPASQRDQSAITMAIDSSLIPQAKEMIKVFRRSLNSFLEEGRKKDSVYQLSVSLYPVTRVQKERSTK